MPYQKKDNEHAKEAKENPQAIRVVELISESDQAVLFHDQLNVGHIAPYGNGRKVFKIRSRQARNLINKIYYDATKRALSTNALQTTLQILEAKACIDGPQIQLNVRVATVDTAIWIDLGEKAVKVAAGEYEIMDEPPILFRRFPHQKPQLEPEISSDIFEILGFLNIKNDELEINGDQLLIIIWTVFAFVPNVPHPVPILNGPQGSKKTTLLNLLKELIDPSAVLSQTSPRGENEFIQTSSHHWFLILDNITYLQSWLSDAICRNVTGAGFQKRELFSDDDDVIYSFKHLVAINGINLVVEKADLLDRSLIFSLQRTGNFQTEKSFWAKFYLRKPYILGSIFRVLAKALELFPSILEPEGSFRMADFAHWGCAITKALGYEPEKFLTAYKANISHQNEEALDASLVGTAVISFMSEQGKDWKGSPSELLDELEKTAIEHKINTNSKAWPKDARWLWKRISEVLPNLEVAGIKADREKDKSRSIALRKVTKNNADNGANVVTKLKQTTKIENDVDANVGNLASKDIKDNKDIIFHKDSSSAQMVKNPLTHIWEKPQ